jgi:hypothetical protein
MRSLQVRFSLPTTIRRSQGITLCTNQCVGAMVLAFCLPLLTLYARPSGDAPLWHDEIMELKPVGSVLALNASIQLLQSILHVTLVVATLLSIRATLKSPVLRASSYVSSAIR